MSRLLAVAALLLSALVSTGPPAQAAERAATGYYGKSSRQVADALGCKRFDRNGGGRYNLDSAVCYLGGQRVNVITYTGPQQQGSWNGVSEASFPTNFFWAAGRGATIVAKNGNRAAAQLGARVLPGRVLHGRPF